MKQYENYPTYKKITEIAKNHYDVFSGADAVSLRETMKARFKTEIIIFACMDGRVMPSAFFDVPAGILNPFKNKGGIFDLKNPFLLSNLETYREIANKNGKKVMFICSYHYSSSNEHLGCAGWKYKTNDALADQKRIKKDLEFNFGKSNLPVIIGFETDSGGITFNSDVDGSSFVVTKETKIDQAKTWLTRNLSNLSSDHLSDLMVLIEGNIKYQNSEKKIKISKEELNHTETCVGYGTGIPVYYQSPSIETQARENFILAVGPWSDHDVAHIETALDLLTGNVNEGRVNLEDGICLIASCSYLEDGPKRNHAATLSLGFLKTIMQAIESKADKGIFLPYFEKIVLVQQIVDERNRKVDFLQTGDMSEMLPQALVKFRELELEKTEI